MSTYYCYYSATRHPCSLKMVPVHHGTRRILSLSGVVLNSLFQKSSLLSPTHLHTSICMCLSGKTAFSLFILFIASLTSSLVILYFSWFTYFPLFILLSHFLYSSPPENTPFMVNGLFYSNRAFEVQLTLQWTHSFLYLPAFYLTFTHICTPMNA